MKRPKTVLFVLWAWVMASGHSMSPAAAAPEPLPDSVYPSAPEGSANIRTGVGEQADRAMQVDRSTRQTGAGQSGVSSGSSMMQDDAEAEEQDSRQRMQPRNAGQEALRPGAR